MIQARRACTKYGFVIQKNSIEWMNDESYFGTLEWHKPEGKLKFCVSIFQSWYLVSILNTVIKSVDLINIWRIFQFVRAAWSARQGQRGI